jgi:hypothetical protein
MLSVCSHPSVPGWWSWYHSWGTSTVGSSCLQSKMALETHSCYIQYPSISGKEQELWTLHNEKLQNFYISPIRWAKQAASMLETWNTYQILVGISDWKTALGRPGRIILKWVLEKWDINVWIWFNRIRIGAVASFCGHSDILWIPQHCSLSKTGNMMFCPSPDE